MQYNRRVMKSYGLDRLPDRRTFDRRFKTISIDIRSRIDAMGMLFIKDGLVDPIVSIDSSLLKAKGHVWLRSNTKNEVPRSGIDRYRCSMGLQQNQGMGIQIQTASSM